MQTRFRFFSFALGVWLVAPTSFAQDAPAPKPVPPPGPAPAAPAPAPAAPAPAPAAPAPTPGAQEEEPVEGEPAEPPAELPPALPETLAAPDPRLSPLPGLPDPGADAAALSRMGTERPAQKPHTDHTDVFAEQWWTHARPILELHGNLRVRAEMFYRFSLNRLERPGSAIWPRPADAPYRSFLELAGDRVALCTPDEAGTGSSDDASNLVPCRNNTQAGANLRFRLNPEIHISDNLRILTQIDLLDNVVLGSTPGGYSVSPSVDGGYRVNPRTGSYEPIGFTDNTTSPPSSAINSVRDSIHVKRVWGEYATPIGELRFGRMPHHWGLGMVNHSGDGYDDDYQTTVDRLQFVTGIKPLDLYFSAALDYPNEGPTSEHVSIQGAQPYDIAQLDDVTQYVFSVARRKSPELQRLALARGEVVWNAGLELTYRSQLLAADLAGDPTAMTDTGGCGTEDDPGEAALGCPPGSIAFQRRDAYYWLPDLWFQLLYKQFRFEVEAATVQGSIGNVGTGTIAPDQRRYRLRQWGVVSELEQSLAEERLRLGLGFGWASGDADVDGLTPSSQSPDTLGQLGGDRNIETFRFHPSYRIDLILYRNILSRVQGAYYFRPNLSYDFIREPTGQRLGGTVSAVWSRASEFVQAPGRARDLGIELNAALYFQSKDGALNDRPTEMGGFYTRLEYGVLFPMGGLDYPSAEAQQIQDQLGRAPDVSSAQTLRLYLGVLF